MGVALQGSLGVTVLGLIASEVPDDQSLVARSRQEHVGAAEMECTRQHEQKSIILRSCGHSSSRSIYRFVRPRRLEHISGVDILLHGGGQGGDPAILLGKSQHS